MKGQMILQSNLCFELAMFSNIFLYTLYMRVI